MKYRKNSLFDARLLKDPARVRKAIAGGADVNARDKNEGTPLYWAWSSEAAIALLEAGADWTVVDNEGLTAAAYTRNKGAEDVANAIERWVAQKRAEAMNGQLDEGEAQHGPGL